jgi:hypothetical protein
VIGLALRKGTFAQPPLPFVTAEADGD